MARSPLDKAYASCAEPVSGWTDFGSYPYIFSESIPTSGAAKEEKEPSNARSNAYIMVRCLTGTTSANMGAFTAAPHQLMARPMTRRVAAKVNQLCTDCGITVRRNHENGMPMNALN
uniref:Uncharacterized protein n=1 Tax=Opuntia streptacantha TaxID=393608 RepID=A0A7C9EU43_OPUST